MNSLPTRQTLLNILGQLISGSIERHQVSKWAVAIIEDDDIVISDRVAWDLLKKLGGVDLIAPDRQFLYDYVDFSLWRNSVINEQ